MKNSVRKLFALVLVAALLTVVAEAMVGAPASADPDGAPPEGVWLAGDLHVHTCYSHDAYCPPDDDNTDLDEAYTLGQTVERQFLVAASRDLDFLAITDHNDVRSQTDSGFGAGGVIAVEGYEKSLSGHAQMLGARRIYDAGNRSAADLNAMAERLRADGGAFQINHPAEGSVDHPHDPDWGYGYDVMPDAVEVWNISRLWQPPLPSASSNDDAIRFWEGWLDRGYRIAATGGSDNHYASTTAIQGVGQPTTWVFASETSSAGVLAGLRAGRTFISHQPPAYAGPMLFLEGDAAGDGDYETIVGGTVPPGSDLRVRVEGAPGSFLRVVTTGGVEAFDPVSVTGPDFIHEFTVSQDSTWVRAEIFEPDAAQERVAVCDGLFGGQSTYCRNSLAVLAMTSALYLADDDGGGDTQTATSLTYVGDTRARGEEVELAARLDDDSGAPVPGRTVTFEVRGDTYEAVTGSDGVARTTATISDHGRSVIVTASFAGDANYLPSETAATITWGGKQPLGP